MTKNFKYLIISLIFLCLIILTLYNLQRVTITASDTSGVNLEQYHASLSQKFIGLKFPEIEVKNVIDNAKIITKIEEGLIILLSNTGCNPCQLRELKNLSNLITFSNNHLTVIPLYIKNYNRLEALKLKKLSSFSSDFYYCDYENNLEAQVDCYLNNHFI